jgi:hypothetical protein
MRWIQAYLGTLYLPGQMAGKYIILGLINPGIHGIESH